MSEFVEVQSVSLAVQNQVQVAKVSLETCLARWKDYSSSKDGFSRWIIEMEKKLKPDPNLCATLPEKQQQLAHFQVSWTSNCKQGSSSFRQTTKHERCGTTTGFASVVSKTQL